MPRKLLPQEFLFLLRPKVSLLTVTGSELNLHPKSACTCACSPALVFCCLLSHCRICFDYGLSLNEIVWVLRFPSQCPFHSSLLSLALRALPRAEPATSGLAGTQGKALRRTWQAPLAPSRRNRDEEETSEIRVLAFKSESERGGTSASQLASVDAAKPAENVGFLRAHRQPWRRA